MTVRLGWWTVDTLDAEQQARFWEALLGFRRLFSDPDEGVALVPPPGERGSGFLLYRGGVAEAKQGKNRIHLDLRPADHHAAASQRARELGASPGRHRPGGRHLGRARPTRRATSSACSPSGDGGATGVAHRAWTLDAADHHRIGDFWRDLLGWEEVERDDESLLLRDPPGACRRPPGALHARRQDRKNRIHPDLIPEGPPTTARPARGRWPGRSSSAGPARTSARARSAGTCSRTRRATSSASSVPATTSDHAGPPASASGGRALVRPRASGRAVVSHPRTSVRPMTSTPRPDRTPVRPRRPERRRAGRVVGRARRGPAGDARRDRPGRRPGRRGARLRDRGAGRGPAGRCVVGVAGTDDRL